jgi:hypothetical protein
MTTLNSGSGSRRNAQRQCAHRGPAALNSVLFPICSGILRPRARRQVSMGPRPDDRALRPAAASLATAVLKFGDDQRALFGEAAAGRRTEAN